MRRTMLTLGLAASLALLGATNSCDGNIAGTKCSHPGDIKATGGKVYQCKRDGTWHVKTRVTGPPRPRPSISVVWGP